MALEASASLNILRASRSAGVTTLRSNVSFILNPRWLSLERFGAIAAFNCDNYEGFLGHLWLPAITGPFSVRTPSTRRRKPCSRQQGRSGLGKSGKAARSAQIERRHCELSGTETDSVD